MLNFCLFEYCKLYCKIDLKSFRNHSPDLINGFNVKHYNIN